MQFALYFVLVALIFESVYGLGDDSALCRTWNEIEENLRNDNLQVTCTKSQDCYGLNCSGVAHTIIIPFNYVYGLGDDSALCRTWNEIEENLRNDNLQVTCTKSQDCYGLNCSGVAHGYDIDSRIQLYACENPPSIEFLVNIPKLKVNNIKKRIYHNDSITITKNLKAEFELERKNKELILGLYVHFINNGSLPMLRIPLRFPVISHIGFQVDCLPSEDNASYSKQSTRQPINVSKGISVVSSPSARSFLVVTKDNLGIDDGYSNCSIRNSTCGEEEMCKQLHKMKPDGICVCILNYTRDKNGKCIYGQPKESSSASLLLTAILVPIFVILIIVGAVYASIRFRVCQHLRRRLRVQVYEHVLLGEEEEEDLTNPVA